jgi:hypothetical protein
MERIPNEVRLEIIHQLRSEGDRKALAAAYPTWEKIVEREDKLRNPIIDESRQHGLSTEEFLATFEGSGIRRRQFPEEVRLERFVGSVAYYRACCPVTAERHLTHYESDECMKRLLGGIKEITERAAKAGLNTPGITLSLRACAGDLTGWKACSGNHTDEEIQRVVTDASGSTFKYDLSELEGYNGIDEFSFGKQGLFQRVSKVALCSWIRKLAGLRVLRLDLQNSFRSHKRKYGTSKHPPDSRRYVGLTNTITNYRALLDDARFEQIAEGHSANRRNSHPPGPPLAAQRA